MRPPRSGWTIVFFSILATFIAGVALNIIEGALIIVGGAIVVASYVGYQALMKKY